MAVLAIPRLAVASSSSAEDNGAGVEFEMAAVASTLWKLTVKPIIRTLFTFLIALWPPSTLTHLLLIVSPALMAESLFSLFVVRDDFDRDGWQEYTVAEVTAAWMLVVVEERNIAAHRAVLKGFASHSLTTRATLKATLFTEPVVVLVEVSTRGWLVAVAADGEGHLLLGGCGWVMALLGVVRFNFFHGVISRVKNFYCFTLVLFFVLRLLGVLLAGVLLLAVRLLLLLLLALIFNPASEADGDKSARLVVEGALLLQLLCDRKSVGKRGDGVLAAGTAGLVREDRGSDDSGHLVRVCVGWCGAGWLVLGDGFPGGRRCQFFAAEFYPRVIELA